MYDYHDNVQILGIPFGLFSFGSDERVFHIISRFEERFIWSTDCLITVIYAELNII